MKEIDGSLDYKGGIKTRHILDVFVNEIGMCSFQLHEDEVLWRSFNDDESGHSV